MTSFRRFGRVLVDEHDELCIARARLAGAQAATVQAHTELARERLIAQASERLVESLEADLGTAREQNRVLRRQLANALNTPLPIALNGRAAVLTPAQRELAADDAAWKRIQDGQGDPQ